LGVASIFVPEFAILGAILAFVDIFIPSGDNGVNKAII
jgi:hypothetical protein